jgi:hypothetical protein
LPYETIKIGDEIKCHVSGTYNGTLSHNTEEKTGAKEWQFRGVSVADGLIVRPRVAETTWSTSETRTVYVFANELGEYTLQFELKVRIQIKNKNTGAHIRYAEVTGSKSVKLDVINRKFKIVLLFDDNFSGHSRKKWE